METRVKPIQVEIWSDLVCPFCYIGKRHFEAALAGFAERGRVQVTWKSFQLDPSPERDPSKSIYDLLAEKYGHDVAWARTVSNQTSAMAMAAGLSFDFDRVVPANTFQAHRLAHFAATKGLGSAAEERMMAAYFTEGRNIGDPATLLKLAAAIGLDADEASTVIEGDAFAAEVRRDEDEARTVGVNGVPFFLIEKEIPIHGAQPPEVILQALQAVAAEQPR